MARGIEARRIAYSQVDPPDARGLPVPELRPPPLAPLANPSLLPAPRGTDHEPPSLTGVGLFASRRLRAGRGSDPAAPRRLSGGSPRLRGVDVHELAADGSLDVRATPRSAARARSRRLVAVASSTGPHGRPPSASADPARWATATAPPVGGRRRVDRRRGLERDDRPSRRASGSTGRRGSACRRRRRGPVRRRGRRASPPPSPGERASRMARRRGPPATPAGRRVRRRVRARTTTTTSVARPRPRRSRGRAAAGRRSARRACRGRSATSDRPPGRRPRRARSSRDRRPGAVGPGTWPAGVRRRIARRSRSSRIAITYLRLVPVASRKAAGVSGPARPAQRPRAARSR